MLEAEPEAWREYPDPDMPAAPPPPPDEVNELSTTTEVPPPDAMAADPAPDAEEADPVPPTADNLASIPPRDPASSFDTSTSLMVTALDVAAAWEKNSQLGVDIVSRGC